MTTNFAVGDRVRVTYWPFTTEQAGGVDPIGQEGYLAYDVGTYDFEYEYTNARYHFTEIR